jgi:hypothetical protein
LARGASRANASGAVEASGTDTTVLKVEGNFNVTGPLETFANAGGVHVARAILAEFAENAPKVRFAQDSPLREGDSNPRSQVKKNPLVETVCSTFPAFPFRDGPRRVYSPPPNLGACSTQIAHRRYVLYLRKCLSRSAPEHRQPLAGLAPLPSRFLPRRTGKRNGRDGSLLDSNDQQAHRQSRCRHRRQRRASVVPRTLPKKARGCLLPAAGNPD